MPLIINKTDVEASPEEVFELMSDYTRYPDWVDIVTKAELIEGDEIKEGAVYEETTPLGPIKSKSTWRVTEFNPPNRQVHIGDMPFGTMTLTIEIEPNDDNGTTLIHEIEITALPKLRPLGQVLEKLFLERKIRKDMKESLEAFAELAENQE